MKLCWFLRFAQSPVAWIALYFKPRMFGYVLVETEWESRASAEEFLVRKLLNIMHFRIWGSHSSYEEFHLLGYNRLATYFILVSCLAYSSTLKIEAKCSFEMSVDFRLTKRRYIPEVISLCNEFYNGRAIAQVVSRWLPTAVVRGRFSPSTSVSPAKFHSTNCSKNHPHLSSGFVQWAKFGAVPGT
jgi:hypothetical protein